MSTPDSSASTNAFTSSAFQRFFASRIAYHFAMQIMTTAVGWQVWDVTHQASYLAWIGLAVFLPVLLLVVPAGLATDRYDRKLILGICMVLEAGAAIGLLIFSMLGEASTTEIVKTQNPQGFVKNKTAAKQGGAIAGNARKALEVKTGKKIVSGENYLPEAKKNIQLKKEKKAK